MVAIGWRILRQSTGGFVLTLFLGNLVVRGLIKGPLGTFRLVVKRDEPCRSIL